MRVAKTYPPGTVGGCCFITKRSEIRKNERVIDLEIELDTLPSFGRLCINEGAVRLMAAALDLQFDDNPELVTELGEKIAELQHENDELRELMRRMVDIASDLKAPA
jgi:hypothetical protein